jgi:hypothetical protein
VPWRTFYGMRTRPTRASRMLHQCFMPYTHQNAQCDPQITPDAKTQLQSNVSRHQLFFDPYRSHPSMKNSVLMFYTMDAPKHPTDPQVALDAKTQIRRNIPQHNFYGMRTWPTRASKILRPHFAPRKHQKALHDPQIALDTRT